MLQSFVIDVAGSFVGAAVSHDRRFRFIAVDPRVDELDGSIWSSVADIRRVAGHLVTTGKLPPACVQIADVERKTVSAGSAWR